MKLKNRYHSVIGAGTKSSNVSKIYFCALSLSCFVWSCNTTKCEFPVYFQVSSVHPGTSLRIDLDSGSYSNDWKFDEGFVMEYDERFEFLQSYCSSRDSILVKCWLNDEDTIFHIPKREIKGCFISEDINGKIGVNYDYYEGGLRDYKFD